MANQKNDIKKIHNADTSALSPQQASLFDVACSSPVFFNNMSLAPSRCTWEIKPSDIEERINSLAREYLGQDARFTTLSFRGRPGKRDGGAVIPVAHVWIGRNCRHLTAPKTDENPNALVKIDSVHRSQDLRRFAEQFGDRFDENNNYLNPKKRLSLNNTLPGEGHDPSIVGIRLDYESLLCRFFDLENRGFLECTNGITANAHRTSLDVINIYELGNDKRETRIEPKFKGEIPQIIQFTKALATASRKNARPQASYNSPKNNNYPSVNGRGRY